MTIHNLDGVKEAEKLGFSRVVLARELSIKEIEYIRKNTKIELEVFIHGALCISYSGQCLLSSMIGGRSGNRGLCAQPCRLPYQLFEKTNEKTTLLDNKYILSPRDNCGIEYLPELIKLGINSLKIEGRMKTPLYVGVVTKIYRKYIDLVIKNSNLDINQLKDLINKNLNIKNPETNQSDFEELMQVFNRGEFSTGHFSPKGNKNLIFKEKSNNMGIYIGKISNINKNKGHLTLKLENSLSIKDRISINNETYNVSELMIKNQNYETINSGSTVQIGRMKGNLNIGDKIYKIESNKLLINISPTFKENKNYKKISLNGEITIKNNLPISLTVWSDDGFYKNLKYTSTSLVTPSAAQNQPITKEKILSQLSKTGNTEFQFDNLKINLDDNLFIQMSVINDLRRNALTGLENLLIEKNTHNLKNSQIILEKNNNITIPSSPTISLLINILDKNYDYTNLENIDKIYIPLLYFVNKTYENIVKNICNKFCTYIYMPTIIKTYTNINFSNIISSYNIKGAIISHISQLELLANYKLDLIGNFTLNIYNNFTINKLKQLNLSQYTISPELEKYDVSNLTNIIPAELIVYGNIPVMTNNYCYLGKSNKCYPECNKKCLNENSIFYLNDRMNLKFRILPNNGLTTIFNSKILSIKYDDLPINSIRIDILDEPSDSIQNIINTVISKNRFEGKNFTNGKFSN